MRVALGLRTINGRAGSNALSGHPCDCQQNKQACHETDDVITRKIEEALRLIGVRVLDHVIVAPGAAHSMAEMGSLQRTRGARSCISPHSMACFTARSRRRKNRFNESYECTTHAAASNALAPLLERAFDAR